MGQPGWYKLPSFSADKLLTAPLLEKEEKKRKEKEAKRDCMVGSADSTPAGSDKY